MAVQYAESQNLCSVPWCSHIGIRLATCFLRWYVCRNSINPRPTTRFAMKRIHLNCHLREMNHFKVSQALACHLHPLKPKVFCPSLARWRTRRMPRTAAESSFCVFKMRKWESRARRCLVEYSSRAIEQAVFVDKQRVVLFFCTSVQLGL